MALTRSILRSGIAASATGLLRAGMFRLDADAVTRALPDLIAFTAVGGAATDPVAGANVLLNDAPATSSVTELGGVAIAGGGSATAAGSAGGSFEVWSDGACVFSPGADFAALPLGRTASSRVLYRTDLGGGAYLTALVTGSLQLAYELAVENGGAFGSTAGLLSPGLEVELTGLSPITAAVVGSVTRTAGGAGIAFLSFADDGAALQYAYTQSPEVDRVGVALVISVPIGAAGRVVETAAVGGGFFRVDIVGDNLVATVSDGSTLLTASRALPARDEVFGFTAALGSGGLFLALSGDTAGNVVNASRAGYDAPIAETLRIGGAGAHLYGGQLASPADFTAAEAATAAADVMATYGNQYFWNEYPSIRIHDANNLDSLSQTDGQQVGDWLDISGNNFAAYRQNGGTETGVTVATSNGLKYVQGGGAGGGYLEASADTDLRGREAWVLFQAPSSGRLLSNQENLDFWIRGSHGDIRIAFGKTLYGVTSMISPYGTTVSANQWYVMRLVFSENNGAELWTDEDLDASRGGGFSSSPTETFKIPRLFSDASGNTTVAGAAFIGIFPTTGSAGALTATQVTAAWNELGARRDILNGV